MKQNLISTSLIVSLALTACGAEQPPTLSAADVAGTAQAMAFTVVAETQAAIPTNTSLPPTETASPTSLPTDTPTASPTIDPLLSTATFTLDPNVTAPSQSTCNQPLTSWTVPTIKILIENETQPKGKHTLALSVKTASGECGYIPVYSGSVSGPEGYYSAFAWVEGKKNFQVSGGFLLTGGSWTIIIRNEQIVAKGGCYPNC